MLTACGSNADVVINVNKKQTSMNIKSGVFTKYEPDDLPSGKKTTGYSFVLGNFEMNKDLDKYGPDLTDTGQIKIQFALNVLENDAKEMKLQTGKYEYSASMEATRLKLGSFRVFTYADGKEDIWARMGGTKESFVTLTSITDEAVSGEIVFKDGDESVKGKFNAKLNKE
jgi:hypothetical protein